MTAPRSTATTAPRPQALSCDAYMADGLELHSEAVPPKCLEPEDNEGGGGDRTAEHYAKRGESLIPAPGGGQLLLHKIQLVHYLSEVIAGLGGLPEGKAVGVEVIGHVTLTSTCLVNIALRPAPGASSQRIYSRAGEGATSPAPD